MVLKYALRDIRTMAELFAAEEREAAGEVAGAEHLLLAALDLEEGSARSSLAALNLTPTDLRTALESTHAEALASVGIVTRTEFEPEETAPPSRKRPYPTTATSQACFRRAVALAKDQRDPLRGAHIVLAVSELQHGTAARLLTRLGIDRSRLQQAARDALADS